MAKYAIDDTTLTDIADAIRAKNQSSDTMTPAEMAAAIAGISAGGGVPSGLSAIEVISFTPSSNLTSVKNVTHSLGVVPDGYCMAAVRTPAGTITSTTMPTIYSCFDVSFLVKSKYYSFHAAMNTSGSVALFVNSHEAAENFVTADTVKIHINSSAVLKSGVTYQVIVYKR